MGVNKLACNETAAIDQPHQSALVTEIAEPKKNPVEHRNVKSLASVSSGRLHWGWVVRIKREYDNTDQVV